MTPDELLKLATEQSGKHPASLMDMLRGANWNAKKLAEEMKTEGWLGRLEEVLIVILCDRSVRRIGPEGAADLSDERCAELVSPKLRRAIGLFENQSVLLLGPTGIGKTMAARNMARKTGRRMARQALLKTRYALESAKDNPGVNVSVAWHTAIDLDLAASRYPMGKGVPKEVYEARNSDLTILDDLTWAKNDHTTLEILHARQSAGRPTIVTAGCTRKELVERFGDGPVRRLLENKGVKGLLVEES